MNAATIKQICSDRFSADLSRPLQKWRDDRAGIVRDLFNRPFRNDSSAVCSGTRSHFDQPVGFFQNLYIMVYQKHGITVGNQIMHNIVQPYDICGMQPDRRLIQNIKHAGRPVSDRSCELHSLTFSCR